MLLPYCQFIYKSLVNIAFIQNILQKLLPAFTVLLPVFTVLLPFITSIKK
jgi:hypothetical protein